MGHRLNSAIRCKASVDERTFFLLARFMSRTCRRYSDCVVPAGLSNRHGLVHGGVGLHRATSLYLAAPGYPCGLSAVGWLALRDLIHAASAASHFQDSRRLVNYWRKKKKKKKKKYSALIPPM